MYIPRCVFKLYMHGILDDRCLASAALLYLRKAELSNNEKASECMPLPIFNVQVLALVVGIVAGRLKVKKLVAGCLREIAKLCACPHTNSAGRTKPGLRNTRHEPRDA